MLLTDITSWIVVKKVTDKLVWIDADLNFSRILLLADMLCLDGFLSFGHKSTRFGRNLL
jgi:hypothetical protein